MSRDLNKVQLTGRLGADPETRYTTQGSAITKLRLATNRSWTTEAGEQVQDTEWTTIIAWNKLAEICAQYLRKGSRVYIEGRLQTRSWEDQASGQKRYATEVVANDMIMLDSRRDSMGGGYEEQDVGYQDIDAEGESARSYTPRAETNRAPQQPARATSNSNTAPARPAPRPAPSNSAPRRPVAPTNDDDDLPF
jgi:single-strand DNA-binding protein